MRSCTPLAVASSLLASGAMLFHAGSAAADTITYNTISRSLVAGVGSVPLTNSTPGTWVQQMQVFDPSNDGASFASQNSTLAPDGLSGTLTARATDGAATSGGVASSLLTTTFTLTSATPCTITGSWLCQNPSPGVVTDLESGAGLVLSGPGGTVYSSVFAVATPVFTAPLSFADTLPAGTYTLSVTARYTFRELAPTELGARTAQVNFVALLPAPGSAATLCIAGLLAARRRRH